MMQRHACMTGGVRTGDTYDCPQCRGWLLEAFRAPVATPVPPQPVIVPEVRSCPFCAHVRAGIADLSRHIHSDHPAEYASWKAHPAVRSQPHRTLPLDPDSDLSPEEQEICAYCARPMAERACAFCASVPAEAGEHVTEHGTEDDPDQPGGDWFARCSCGWVQTGHYARDGMGAHTAGRLAKITAQQHRSNPGGTK